MSLKEELTKEIIISNNDGFTLLKLDNKQLGVAFGLMAYLMLFQGATDILLSPWLSVMKLIYGFFICLPVAYLQMEKHREIERYIHGERNESRHRGHIYEIKF